MGCSVVCLETFLAMGINSFMSSNTVRRIVFQKRRYQLTASLVFYIYISLSFYCLSYILVPSILVNFNMFAHYINPLF